MIPETMKTSDLHQATLVSLAFAAAPAPPVAETGVLTGREMLATAAAANDDDPAAATGTLAFVVRRPGWPLVRGDARLLQAQAAAGDLAGFRLRAVVKETGVDDAGLREFATDYFPHPTYKDQDLAFYAALGSGKLSLGYNPLAMLQFIRQSLKRIKDLGIESYNTKGEGFLQGGWILFDQEGTPRAAFRENAKQRVPVDDIVAAARAITQARAGDSGDAEEG